jgi:cytochrome P450
MDVTRADADKHLAYGYGQHACVGRRVAQIQFEAAYRQHLAWFLDQVGRNNFVYAVNSMSVKFTPA